MFEVVSGIEDWQLPISSHEENIIKKFMNKNDEKIIREILNFYDFSEDFYSTSNITSKYLIYI